MLHRIFYGYYSIDLDVIIYYQYDKTQQIIYKYAFFTLVHGESSTLIQSNSLKRSSRDLKKIDCYSRTRYIRITKKHYLL